MALSSPVSPRDLALKEKRFQSVEEIEAAYNILVRRMNDVYKYNRRDHDRLTEDVEDGTVDILFSNIAQNGAATGQIMKWDGSAWVADADDVSEGEIALLVVEAHTANDTLLAAENGSVHTNRGATGTITLTLPASASTGTRFTFCVQETQQMRVDPGTATIRDNSNPSLTADKYIWADAIGETITLCADSNGDWMTIYKYGVWSREA